MGGMRMHTKCWSGNLKGREQMEEIDIDEKIILKCILKK
jgi:hypothetical protein